MLQAASAISYSPIFGGIQDAFTPVLRAKYAGLLEGSLYFGLKAPPAAFIERVKKIPGGDRLVDYRRAALAYATIKQMYAAARHCPTRAIECLVTALADSPPDETTGFEGFRDRVAQMQMVMQRWSAGGFHELAVAR